MSNLTHTEIIERILQALIGVIGRRTSESYAVVTVHTVLKELEPEYDFLKYIKIKETIYSEGIDAISITPGLDSAEPAKFYRAIEELIKSTVIYIDKNAGFYFIKEFQEAIADIDGLVLKERDIDLGFMQLEYVEGKKQEIKIVHSKIVEHVIKTLIHLVNRTFPEKQAIKTVITSIKKLEKKYDFLKYIEMNESPNPDSFYDIRVIPDINNVHSSILSKAIEQLIEDLGRPNDFKTRLSFIKDFKFALGVEDMIKLEKIGVKLESIQGVLLQQEHEVIVKKTLEALVDILGSRTSESDAVSTLENIINQLEEKHDVLKYIKMGKSRYSGAADALQIIPDINSVDSYEIGKAMREIIRLIRINLGERGDGFIEEFKNKLGNEYLSEIEKMGVNLYFLELKYI
jgi:hypothetical protein